ncbi:hypothetical protein CR105_00275 [Massilia eurypsychrophila]|uniref:Uncharacterized protein n=2 Tax=Massilia eurypsychrophila TaxID=1485217 RepID=A0A2G8TLZ4_9BURK|nr:hypothetical protein CR105_00275 [Massilia eurypsychrophila]
MADKRERFVALAEKRVSRAIHELRLIGNLSNTHNYTYTHDDAHRIVTALEQEIKLLKGRFAAGVLKNQPKFKL